MIPQEKSAAVTQALHEAFGVTTFEDIRRLTKGNSTSLVFRIVVRGTPFLLKMIMRKDDATRNFACMRSAAAAGLAPHVWYTSPEDRLAITDFLETTPLKPTDALVRIPAMLRALHALPPFPGVPNQINTTCMFLLNPGPAVDGFMQMFRAANILADGVYEEVIARFKQLAAVYPRHDAQMVSSHNDLFKPDNMLFDGQRLWLVDWEAAFLNDRYADLAVVANMIVTNDEEERVYLQEYFGRPPDPYQRARFFLMQQVAHVFYTMAFLFASRPEQPVDFTENPPDYGEFQRRFWSGEVALVDTPTKIAFARVHWERLLQNMQQPRFHEAVRIVSGDAGQTTA